MVLNIEKEYFMCFAVYKGSILAEGTRFGGIVYWIAQEFPKLLD